MKLDMSDKLTRLSLIFGASLLLWLVLYGESLVSAVLIWSRSGTFTHGFIIVPVAFFLAWRRRYEVVAQVWRPTGWLLLPLLANALLWRLGELAQIDVLQQLCAFAFLPLLIWCCFGHQVARVLAFPMFYLLFAVPMGEELVPWLQQVTADISVFALQVTGIPVYRDGLYITVPNGYFEVAVACSGIRYLIASLALGTLYAYLSYEKLQHRLWFLVLALVVPIVANGLRAYGIIMIAHLSDMKYATGVDHLVYGWVFFGLVMAMLFYLGSFWGRPPVYPSEESGSPAIKGSARQSVIMMLALSLVLLMPDLHQRFLGQPSASVNWQSQGLAVLGEPAGESNWQPQFVGAEAQLRRQHQGTGVELYLAYYGNQADGELVAWNNKIYQEDKWGLVDKQGASVTLEGQQVLMNELILSNTRGERRILWYGYQVAGQYIASAGMSKLTQALARLLGGSGDGFVLAVSTPYLGEPQVARERLAVYLNLQGKQLLALQDPLKVTSG